MEKLFRKLLNVSNPIHTVNSVEQDQLLKLIINYMPDLIIIKDAKGRWIEANDFTLELFKIYEYKGKSSLEIAKNLRPAYREFLEKNEISDEEAWKTGKPLYANEMISHPDKKSTILDVLKLPVFDSENNRNKLLVIGRDISQQVYAKEQLKENEQRLKTLVAASVDVFVISDKNGIMQYTSNACKHVLGYSPYERIGKSIFGYTHHDDIPLYKQVFFDVVKNPLKVAQIEIRIRHSDGSFRLCEIVLRNSLNDPNVQGIVINYRDITEKKQAQNMIEHMAYHDSLTDLYNRHYFEKQLAAYLSDPSLIKDRFAILYFDLDRFKYVNDTLGHLFGDRLLIEVAKRVSRCLRESDIFTRFGGDEFALLLPDVNPEGAIQAAQHILSEFKTPFILDHYELHITTSIGISLYPDDGQDVETLMKYSDIALYRAKERGKNQYQIFTPKMNVKTYMTFMMQQDLRKAIERNQLVIFYQPRVDPRTNKIVSAEALLRWNHPEWGVVLPKEFIPIAEETDLIIQIGQWALEAACIQNKQWQDMGLLHIPISVNVSGRQLMYKDIIQTITLVLNTTGLDAKWLELEMTETTIIENPIAVSQSIQQLRELGIKIAIDDFGTGYSSLGRLKDFRIDTIKIDKSFIKNSETDQVHAEIIKSVIGLAHAIGQTVVAEGVESEDQLNILKMEKCDQIQGFYYCPPVDPVSFQELLRNETIKYNTNSGTYINKRSYYRKTLEYPIIGKMTVDNLNGKAVNIGYTNVLIEDIGGGGLRFLTNIRLPMNENLILRFEFHIFENMKFIGHIVWMHEIDENLQEYGLKFLLTDLEERELIQIIHRFSIQTRKSSIVSDCDFYLGSKSEFFKSEVE